MEGGVYCSTRLDTFSFQNYAKSDSMLLFKFNDTSTPSIIIFSKPDFLKAIKCCFDVKQFETFLDTG